MATLIAANYQSTTITSYGGMSMSCGTLKANTLYTLKCRYKYTKNTSSYPQILCYNSNWSYGGSIYDASDDGVMKTRVITFTSYPSAVNYNIACYAWSYDNQNNGVGGKTGVLEVDWYELWEGDATTFSLTDAIALSNNKSEDDFLAIQNGCQNTGYFSTAEPIYALRSWIGYYYKTHSSTSYGDWAYTYNHYTSASRSRTVTTYDHYSNGKVVQTGSTTQTESATVTYANWSYNWTTTGNSTRSRTVTYSWSDYSSTATQTETGGTRYIVLDSFSDGKSEGSEHLFSAAGGSITARTVSHDYWPNTSGTCIQTVVITGVTTTCTGFTCTTSGSTVTITAASKGTNESAANQATLTSTKSGWQTRSYGSCKQAENKITSVSLSASVSSGTLTAVSAAGGTVTWTPTVKYSSGSTSSDTSKFTPTYSVANYATVTGFATKGYSAATGNYNYQQIGGSYSVANGEKFLCTLGSASVTAGSPAGYAILAYDLSEGQNRGGVQLSNSKLADVITTNAADTLEFIMYAGINGATAGVAVTYNNLCISRMGTAGSGATQSGNKTTWATLGTTTGGRNAAVTVSVKSTYTTTAVTATAYTAQAYNAVTSVKAVVNDANVSSVHFTYSGGTSISKTGGSIDVTPNGACKFTFTSGATAVQGTGGTYYGGTLSFSRSYKKDTANTDWLTLNTSSGKITAANNTTSSVREAQITGNLTATWGSLTHTLAQSRTVKQNAGSKVYGDPTITFSYATFAAAGATKTPTFSYSQVWTWNGVSGSGGTVTTGATDIVYGMTAKTGFTLNSTSTGSITAANNTTTSARSTTASVSFKLNGKTGSKTATVSQNAGTRTYQIVLDPTSITWAASGGSVSVAVKYNTLWNGIKTAGPTTLTGYTVSPSNCTASGTSGTTTITVGQNTSSSQIYPQATFSKDGYTPATLTGTQNKPVTSTETVYRVSSLSNSSITIGNSSGIDSISVYMDKATRTYYKNTTSGSVFKTTTGSWSRVTGKEAAAAGISFYIYFQSINNSDTNWIRTGTPTLNLTNGTSTSAAMWYANYAYDANTNSTSRQVKMLIVHSTSDDIQGAGKNYCTITQSAGQARIPIQIWGRNENRTEIYVSFSQMKVYVYQSSNTSETHVENVAFGGGISAGTITERRQLAYTTWYVDRLTYPTITQVTVKFDDVNIDNTLDPYRYRNVEVWAEVCEGDISMEGYGVSGRYKSSNSATIITAPYESWYGQEHTFVFNGTYVNGSYSPGAPLNDNSVVVLFFRFYDY